MSITADNCMSIILAEIPGYRTSWDEHMLWWGDDTPSLGNNMASFSQYVAGIIISDMHEELDAVFRLIEKMVAEGTTEVRTAATTNCLENIINSSSQGKFSPATFIGYLGKESKEFCDAWDRFTGRPLQ